MQNAFINNFTALNYSQRAKNNQKNRSNLNRKKLYWISQITGWSLFVLINLIIISTIETVSIKRIVVWLLYGLFGLLFTHFFRLYIKKQDWINLPLKKIVPGVIIASIILGILISIPVFTTSFFIEAVDHQYFTTARLFAATINVISTVFLWSLIYFAIKYFDNYKKAEIESLIFEAAIKDFELKTLKAQLNPHFMFNAMNSIRSLIEEDPQSAKDAITKLSNLLRYALKIERTETVPLGEELKTIQDYLDLERIRFEERLKYVIRTTPDSERVEIPPMMIQTLVENGIKHGISKSMQGGEVSIDSEVLDEKLFVRIRNTGHFSEEDLKNSKGFGISNTKHRLNLLYGEKAFFTIKNENQNKVISEVTIPLGGTNR